MSQTTHGRRKVYMVNPQTAQYGRMWEENGFELVPSLAMADIVNFQGGADVSPELYGERELPLSHCNYQRDVSEKRAYDLALKMGKFMVGICRGGQFLNVMNGGRMWQDVNHHTMSHTAVDLQTEERFVVTSTHHQMMRPAESGEILMVAAPANIATYKIAAEERWNLGGKESDPDVEVVWYPETRSLCFQPHPEFEKADETRRVFFMYLDQCYLEKQLEGQVA